MLNMDDARINSRCQFSFLLHSATACLDPHPVTVDDAVARCGLWVDFGEGCWCALRRLAIWRCSELKKNGIRPPVVSTNG